MWYKTQFLHSHSLVLFQHYLFHKQIHQTAYILSYNSDSLAYLIYIFLQHVYKLHCASNYISVNFPDFLNLIKHQPLLFTNIGKVVQMHLKPYFQIFCFAFFISSSSRFVSSANSLAPLFRVKRILRLSMLKMASLYFTLPCTTNTCSLRDSSITVYSLQT